MKKNENLLLPGIGDLVGPRTKMYRLLLWHESSKVNVHSISGEMRDNDVAIVLSIEDCGGDNAIEAFVVSSSGSGECGWVSIHDVVPL